jgi:hypothetical protein
MDTLRVSSEWKGRLVRRFPLIFSCSRLLTLLFCRLYGVRDSKHTPQSVTFTHRSCRPVARKTGVRSGFQPFGESSERNFTASSMGRSLSKSQWALRKQSGRCVRLIIKSSRSTALPSRQSTSPPLLASPAFEWCVPRLPLTHAPSSSGLKWQDSSNHLPSPAFFSHLAVFFLSPSSVPLVFVKNNLPRCRIGLSYGRKDFESGAEAEREKKESRHSGKKVTETTKSAALSLPKACSSIRHYRQCSMPLLVLVQHVRVSRKCLFHSFGHPRSTSTLVPRFTGACKGYCSLKPMCGRASTRLLVDWIASFDRR